MTGPRLALVGDCIPSRPLSPSADRIDGFAGVIDVLGSADATIGNLETPIVALDQPGLVSWGVPDDWAVRAEPSVAGDLRALGFDAFARANNHGMDWGVAGMRETTRLLDQVGLVHAGTGESLSAASRPSFVETVAGRVGLISATTTPSPLDVAPALDAFHGVPPRPGVHTLRVRATITTDAEHLEWLRDLKLRIPEFSTAWTDEPGDMEFGRATFGEGEEAVAYEVEPEDADRLVSSVRLARANADVVVVMLHIHQGDRPGELPPTFQRELGRAAIEAGADAVAVSGPHRLCSVEIHAGRPILHGLGNFIWSDLHEPLPAYFWERTRRSMGERAPDPSVATDADLLAALNAEAFDDPEVFRAVIAEVAPGAPVRLRPVELGYGEPLTRRGIPRVPSDDVAAQILATIGERSTSMGVRVDPDGSVRPTSP